MTTYTKENVDAMSQAQQLRYYRTRLQWVEEQSERARDNAFEAGRLTGRAEVIAELQEAVPALTRKQAG